MYNDTHSVIAKQCGEVGSLQTVYSVHKLGTVHSICSCENTSWEQAQLQKLCDSFILSRFGWSWQEPRIFFL